MQSRRCFWVMSSPEKNVYMNYYICASLMFFILSQFSFVKDICCWNLCAKAPSYVAAHLEEFPRCHQILLSFILIHNNIDIDLSWKKCLRLFKSLSGYGLLKVLSLYNVVNISFTSYFLQSIPLKMVVGWISYTSTKILDAEVSSLLRYLSIILFILRVFLFFFLIKLCFVKYVQRGLYGVSGKQLLFYVFNEHSEWYKITILIFCLN